MEEREQEQDWKQVEKGSNGGGESSASGSFAALRMTAKTGAFPFDKLRLRMTAKTCNATAEAVREPSLSTNSGSG
jgi:hypothetical protein